MCFLSNKGDPNACYRCVIAPNITSSEDNALRNERACIGSRRTRIEQRSAAPVHRSFCDPIAV